MLTLNDGRSELWQWDTGRTLAVDADCSQVHFSNKVFGRSIDVDAVDGTAIIPDILLQTDKDLNAWAFVGTAENGYTKISKTFKVNRRNKPADYVFTQTEQMTLQMIQLQIGDLADLTTEAKDTLVAAINEAARTGGGAGSMELRVADGYVQYSRDGGSTWENLIAMADLKGDPGEPGKDGHSPVVTATKSGKTTTISVDGAAIATVEDGEDGKPGTDGADGVTPHIGDNGNWYLGETDTGKPSRGADGPTGATGSTGEKGADGKSAYAYAVEGGYTGTETEFAAKLAEEIPSALPNPNAMTFTGAVTGSYDGSAPVSVEIPSGGGGRTLELIADVTTAEETTMISITKDSDGNAFKVKSWAAYIYIPAHKRDTAKPFYARGDSYGGGMTFANMLVTSNMEIGFFLYPIANYDAQDALDMDRPLKVQYISSFGGNTADTPVGFRVNLSIFQVYTNNTEVLFPAGVRVRLWGVRK